MVGISGVCVYIYIERERERERARERERIFSEYKLLFKRS